MALQTGFQLKSVLSPEEMAIVVSGYADSMQDKVPNTNEILKAHGPAINDILSKRADSTLKGEKEKGEAYVEEYMKKTPEAIRTDSGLVFHEFVAGSGDPPSEVILLIFY